MASSILNSDDGVISGTSGLKSTGGDDGVLVFQSKGTETARINTDKQIVAAAGTNSLPALTTTGDLNTGIYFPAADTIGFVEGGAEAMRIDSSGNVGIGITSPNATLQVLRAASTGEYLRVGANSAAQDRSLRFSTFTVGGSVDVGHLIDAPGTSSVNGTIAFATNNTERMRIDSSGNVGIGTSSPDEELDVNGNVAIGSTSDAFSEIRFFNSTATSGTTRIRGNADDILFFTGNSERARIASDGAVLFGKTVVDDTTAGFAWRASGYLTIVRDNSCLNLNRITSDGEIVQFRRGGTQVGNISVTGSTTAYTTSSDYRLKENIAPMTGALATVAQLKPCTYTWKADGSNGQGFIAHELAEVCPDAVTGEKDATEIRQVEVSPAVYEDVVIPAVLDEDGNEVEPERTEKRLVSEAVMEDREFPKYQGVDTSFLVATLTAAIQELKAINDAQAQRIETLEAKVAALEAK